MEIPTLLTTRGIAETIGRHRTTVIRLHAAGRIQPVALADLGGTLQPLFDPSVAIVVEAIIAGRAPLQPNPHHIPAVLAGS